MHNIEHDDVRAVDAQERGEESLLSGMKKMHFVGVGGAGMSAIAKILLEKGYEVSGSDLNDSEVVQRLAAAGAAICRGHDARHVTDADAVVVSTAIASENPEVSEARRRGIAVLHRSDVVAALLNPSRGIAVAGAHGKTTTSSMLGVVLTHAGLDPTVIVGGEVDYLGGNARLGGGSYLVAEADESDGSFLKLRPEIAVVTNIENDHMDHYGTMENILQAFETFLHNLPEAGGMAVLCFDSAHIRRIAGKLQRPYLSYGLSREAEFWAGNLRVNGAETTFDVYRKENLLGTVRLRVPGRHNVLNALAVCAVGVHIGLTVEQVAAGLSVFYGAKRRFQTKGKVAGVWVVDDYAHHPTEIATTLAAAKQTEPKRLVCVFQPHRYSRTQLLRKEFGACFGAADVLVLTDIYSAGEAPIPGICGRVIQDEVEAQTGRAAAYIAAREDLAPYLAGIVRPGDLVMTMGAGDICLTGGELVGLLENKED